MKKHRFSPIRPVQKLRLSRLVTVFAFLGFIAGNASAQFTVTPPSAGPITFSPNVVTKANVINLYMASNWNAVAPPLLGETKEAIDSWTQALIGSSYFAFATQYLIGVPHFVGGFNTSSSCAVPSTPSGVIRPWHVAGFVNCNLTTPPLSTLINGTPITNIVVNVFMDPTLTMADALGATCAGGTLTAYHWANQDPSTFLTPFTVISASPTCNANFGVLTSTIAHEMIEAMTDPIALDGWVHRYGVGGLNLSLTLTCGEVSDFCQSPCTKATTVGTLPSGSIPFLGPLGPSVAPASFYWSNSAQACAPPWPITTPVLGPQPVTIQEGLNPDTVKLSISGSGFGFALAALSAASTFGTPPNTTQNTPYFLLTDTSQGGLNAGNSLDAGGDPIALSWTWTNTNVSVQAPGSKFFSCDDLLFTIWNPSDGSKVSGTTTLPGPADIGVAFPQPVTIDEPVTATISVVAAPSTVLATPTQIDVVVDNGVPQDVTVTQTLDVPVTFSGTVGPHTLTVSAKGCSPMVKKSVTVNVGPSVDNISPDHGPATGGTTVTLTGHGLSQTTSVMFGTQSAAISGTPQDTMVKVITAPASPGRVPVSLTATANGIPIPGSGQVGYTFFEPGVPVLTRDTTCEADHIGIQAWGVGKFGNLVPLANAPLTFTLNNASLWRPVITALDSNGTGFVNANAKSRNAASVTVALSTGSASINVFSVFGECQGGGGHPLQLPNPNEVMRSLQGCPTCAFSDVPATKENIYIYAVVAWGLMSGTGNKFQPNGAVTRDQLVAVLQRVAGPRAIEARQRVFGAIGKQKLKQNAVTRGQAIEFLDIALQHAKATKVENPGSLFTRADLARAIWQYAHEAGIQVSATTIPPAD